MGSMPRNKLSLVFFYTYILEGFKDGDRYIGYTANLIKRVEEHNQGKVFSTKSRRPLKLIYYEACLNKEDAQQREKYLKSTIGNRFIKKRLITYLYRKNFSL